MTDFQIILLACFLCAIVIAVFSSIAIAFYFLGKMAQQVKQATQISSLAALTGFFSASQAHGLKNSVVLQRVIEKYHVLKSKDPEISQAAKDMEDKIERAAGTMEDLGKNDGNDLDAYDFDSIGEQV